MRFDDVRKTIEAAVGNLSPSKAQELARGLLEPGTAKGQVAKTAADLIEWSQRRREQLQELVRREIQQQVKGMGVATQVELEALRKRVRVLERAAGKTVSGRSAAEKRKKPASSASTRGRASAADRSASTRATRSTARGSSGGRRGQP